MTDVERILNEAQQAEAEAGRERAEAEAAATRAAGLQTQAAAARQQQAAEREAARRAWAQQLVDAYDANLAAADRALQEAADRFDGAAEDPAAAVKAYLAWAEASTRHYVVQVRVASVAPVVGLEMSEPQVVVPPPFSQALDAALDRRVATRSTQLRDEAAAEIAAHLDDGADGPGEPGATDHGGVPSPASGLN